MELLPFFSYNRQYLKSHDLKLFPKQHHKKRNKKQKSFYLVTLPRKICENENCNVRLLKLNGIKFEGTYICTYTYYRVYHIWNPIKLNRHP